MAKNKFNKSWLQDHLNDPYVKMAQKEGYRARAVYKLSEIDEQDRLIKAGMTIVDLGSAPGSWSQYARNRLTELGKNNPLIESGKPDGIIIAIDILPMEDIADVSFIQGDFREDEGLKALEALLPADAGGKVDLVLSDMAPNLSGISSVDSARVENLVELAIEFAQQHMKPQGALVAKVFHGPSYNAVVKRFKETFVVFKPYKPKASRDRSSETFLVGIGLKQSV